jgi:hypothetical protein
VDILLDSAMVRLEIFLSILLAMSLPVSLRLIAMFQNLEAVAETFLPQARRFDVKSLS